MVECCEESEARGEPVPVGGAPVGVLRLSPVAVGSCVVRLYSRLIACSLPMTCAGIHDQLKNVAVLCFWELRCSVHACFFSTPMFLYPPPPQGMSFVLLIICFLCVVGGCFPPSSLDTYVYVTMLFCRLVVDDDDVQTLALCAF